MIQKEIKIQEEFWNEHIKSRTKALYSKQYKGVKFKVSQPVLEIGGGPGTFLKFLNISKATIIDLAGEKNLVDKNYHFIKKDIRKRLNLERKYKTIFIMETLEHIHNPLYLLAQVYDLLDKDGRCYISVPYTKLDFERTRGLNSHICRWKYHGLKDQMEKIGFNVEVIQKRRRFKNTAFFLPHCWLVLELKTKFVTTI